MRTQNFLTNQLIEAVIHNDVTTVRELLEKGANPNHTLDSSHITPLHYAAQNNAFDVIPILVEHGAKVDAQTEPDGQTPIEVAFLHGHEKLAQMLIAYNRDDNDSIN